MERSKLFLIGGVIVVVIVFMVFFLNGMSSSAPGSRPGFGQERPAGPGQGQAPGSGQGPASGTGPGANAPVLLPMTDTDTLTAAEAGDLLFMREEEQMAHDLYLRWAGMYTVPVFSNIAASETMHIAEVQLLIDRYGLQDTQIGNASVGNYNATIQSLYITLAHRGDASINGAFEAGLAVEERDIADLDHALADTKRADIIQVWSNLRQGSVNHRNAFLRQLGR